MCDGRRFRRPDDRSFRWRGQFTCGGYPPSTRIRVDERPDRLLIMLVAATGFAVVIGAVFVLVLLGIWYRFRDIDEEAF